MTVEKANVSFSMKASEIITLLQDGYMELDRKLNQFRFDIEKPLMEELQKYSVNFQEACHLLWNKRADNLNSDVMLEDLSLTQEELATIFYAIYGAGRVYGTLEIISQKK